MKQFQIKDFKIGDIIRGTSADRRLDELFRVTNLRDGWFDGKTILIIKTNENRHIGDTWALPVDTPGFEFTLCSAEEYPEYWL